MPAAKRERDLELSNVVKQIICTRTYSGLGSVNAVLIGGCLRSAEGEKTSSTV